MNEKDDLELRKYLQANVPAVDLELRRDLWGDVALKFEEKKESVTWFDWLLLGSAVACLIGLPQIIPMLLYQL
jgi:hypothetical protein